MPDDWSVCGGIVETTAQKLRRILWGTEPTTRWLWFILGFALAGLLLAGCATLPHTEFLKERHAAQAARFESALGQLSAKRSAAIVGELKRKSGDLDILDKQIALEQEIVGSPLVVGNKVTLLQDGPATYQAMFAAIGNAKNHINVEWTTCLRTRQRVGGTA